METSRRRSSVAATVELRLSNSFAWVGSQIFRHPVRFLVIPVMLCALLAIGFTRMEIENRGEELYTPQDSESFHHRDLVEEIFGFPPRTTDVYAVGSASDSNLLTKAALLRFLEMYQDISAINVTVGGKSKTRATSCVLGSNGACDQTSVLDLWGYNQTRLAGDPDVLATVNAGGEDALGRTLKLDDLLGGIERNGLGEIVSAKALLYTVDMVNDAVDYGSDGTEDKALNEWELLVGDTVLNNDYSPLSMHPWAEAIQQEESDKALATDISLLGLGVAFLLAYTYVVLSRRSWVHTHGALTFAAVASIGLAAVAAFGLVMAIGVKFNLVVSTLAFLLLALGVDDAYVIMAAYEHEEVRQLPQRERISQALKSAAASISVTSLTDVAAFLAGAFTPLPAIRAFCIYAAVGVLADFLMQCSFFVAALVISGKREAAGRADLLCCIKPEDPEALACTRDKSQRFTGHEEDSSLTKFMSGAFPRALLSPVGKTAALVGTAVLFVLAIFGAMELRAEIQMEWFVPDSSFLQDTYAVRDRYFPAGDNMPFAMYTRDVDYPNLQDELDSLEAALNGSAVIKSCDNWHTDFKRWVGAARVPAADYYGLLSDFVSSEEGAQYVEDIVFRDNATGVAGTKIPCLFTDADSSSKWISDMKEARALAADAPELEAFSYAFIFLFLDGMDVVLETTLINLAVAASAVFVISVCTLVSIHGGVLVFSMLVSTDVMLLGSFYLTGIDFNMVSAVNLVIALGLAVDGNIHITHAFLHARGSRAERTVTALRQLGASTVNGGTSSALVLVALLGAQSYVFQVFFKALFFAVLLGYGHALLVLPVVLSLIGPKSLEDEEGGQQEQGSGMELEAVATGRSYKLGGGGGGGGVGVVEVGGVDDMAPISHRLEDV